MNQGRVKKVYQYGIILALNFSLSACVNLATTGAQAIYHHRSLQKQFNDQYISMQIYKDIQANHQFDNTHISVVTYQNTVLLLGQAPYLWQSKKIQKLAEQTENVKKVYNLLQISLPSSTLKRFSDAWITTKIKSKLIASNDLDATEIKVITENGTVYLMGTVQEEEANIAVELAKETAGVERVVKIFSYMYIV